MKKSTNINYVFKIKTFQFNIFLFLETYLFTFFDNKNISVIFKKVHIKKYKKLYTLLKSPHVNKTSRDQLFFTKYIGTYNLYFFKNYIFGQGLTLFTKQKNISLESHIKYHI